MKLALLVLYASGEAYGGAHDPPSLLPSPSCMLNNESCPIPRDWEVDWSVINSTALMASRGSAEEFNPVHRWGYVTLDWQAGWKRWVKRDPRKATCEATSSDNCVRLKQAGKVKRCGIYHNMQLALEWLESERVVMDDAHVKQGWFLTYPNGTVFDQKQHVPTPEAAWQSTINMSQWVIDWRNADAADYFVGAILNSTFLPGVDATFTDDLPGVGSEDKAMIPATRLTNTSVAAIRRATQQAEMSLASALAISGKFCWDCVGGEDGPAGTSYSMNQQPPPNTTAGCTAWFRHYCKPEMQGHGMFLGWSPTQPAPTEAMAAFLIARGPYAFVGGRGLRDSAPTDNWHPLFGLDVGEPLELCQEHAQGVFTRRWSKGTAALDCNRYQGELPFPRLPDSELY